MTRTRTTTRWTVILLAIVVFLGGCTGKPAGTGPLYVNRQVCAKCGKLSKFDLGCPTVIYRNYQHRDVSALHSLLDDAAEGFAADKTPLREVKAKWGPPHNQEPGKGVFAGHTHVQYGVYKNAYNFGVDAEGRVSKYVLAEGVGEYKCKTCGGKWVRRWSGPERRQK
jgi:hypothetical protein